MVQIISPSPAAMQRGQIGQALGIGASKMAGLEQAENAANMANGDPVKLAFSLARASMAAPGMERSLGQIYEQLLSRTNAKGYGQGLNDVTGGSGQDPLVAGQSTTNQPGQPPQNNPNTITPIANDMQQPQPTGGQKTSHNIDAIANQYLGEVRPDLVNPETAYGAINTFDAEIKQDLTPAEEAGIRQKLMKEYNNPNVANQVVERIREGVRNKFNENKTKYGFDQDKINQIKEKWNNFSQGTEDRLKPHLSKYDNGFNRTKEILTGKYNQYAASSNTNMTPEQMHTNAMALLQNDINRLDAVATLPSAPPFRNEKDANEYINKYKGAYKELADEGFVEALKEDAILNKDLGNEEFHSLIWGDQTSKPVLNELHSFKPPKEYTQIKGAYNQDVNKYNPKYPEQQEKYINDLASTLKKLKPKDDLMIARAMVLDSNGTIEDFNKALSKAKENGLELSKFQESQLQEVSIPRVPPLYEVFSEKNFLKPMFKAWAPWINYMRGKK